MNEAKVQIGQIFSRGSTGENVHDGKVESQKVIGTPAAVQSEPVDLPLFTGDTGKIFVEGVSREKSFWAVHGWSTLSNIELILHRGKDQTKLEITRHSREDVCKAHDLPSLAEPGFAATCPTDANDKTVDLEIRFAHGKAIRTGRLAFKNGLSPTEKRLFPEMLEAILVQLASHAIGSLDWWDALNRLPAAAKAPSGFHGFIEGVIGSPEGNGVIFGWALHPDDAQVWVETSEGDVYALDQGFRRVRQDISSAFFDVAWRNMESGFILHVPKIATGSKIKLCVATPQGKLVLSEKTQTDSFSPDPRLAATKLFSIETEDRTFQRRASVVDWPILEPLIRRGILENATIKSDVHLFGQAQPTPKLSVIVPLYRRFDFIEHQVLEFSRDKIFRENTEVVYVVDDPEITERVLIEANALFTLYGLPIKVVDGHRNRGFSGANNLGAAHASGDYLLFMNSDVIPRKPGWLSAMLSVFDTHKNAGAVGARLLFPDGGLQHAGMESVYLNSLGIWSNQHPGMGMSPDHDGGGVRQVASVTGACLLVPTSLFANIGGWDTGYLLGDFEDSDLCFAIRKAGYEVIYQPEAELTHLERQSFTGIGGDHFRLRMTICNAVRHQRRWSDVLTSDNQPNTQSQTVVVEE